MNNRSSIATLILAGLTKAEFARFHAAHVPYSGSTGPCKRKLYPATGPYIATIAGELESAVIALKWKWMSMEHSNGQLICRKSKKVNTK